ncbi:hypothetical protein Ahy_B08g092945 isoform C [Arachis hypogaea]|uniref:non-specific serine/threonine protein kinase n=1 Tax=Arachis hypogaea TaxID=3818 RepID=A0A444Y4T7_ARAHY|nr:hypothetical protein Ahy_B08g092945 isoform C [Arachis hypogaea]
MKRYLGIWYNEVVPMTVVWVAKRNNPLNDSSGLLKITDKGLLVLLNNNNSIFWSSNSSSNLTQQPVALLWDSGNLIVNTNNKESEYILWHCFDYPFDTLLPGMMLGTDLTTGLNRNLTSRSSPDDPSNIRVLSDPQQDLYVRMSKKHSGNLRSNSEEHEEEELELPLFDRATFNFATNRFSTDNILGTGGFGSVYKVLIKGILESGKEIAVKRLRENSRQGLKRNISTTYLSSKADGDKGILLDWPKRFLIINGIALGLLYLHQDSRHRVIHRDLKAGNILLDIEINPKISYFGLARSILGNKNEATTNHVVGTYGYMAPEYIIDGLFSTKSDIYSFGVLVLEIVSGKSNRAFNHRYHHFSLLGHASTFFIEHKSLDIVDASIRDSINLPEVMRSIHVGLLCVQQSLEDRPNMSYVLKVLSSEWELPQPKKLGFFTQRDLVGGSSSSSSSNNKVLSINKLSVSEVDPR